ncbi:MAG: alpha-L-fucosidase [Clostridia bacterium]|nr:alpha-L-fucosidase [Clostridia bacterium]
MIFKQYIKDFENFGLGMFVHFGLYSVIGHGEWVKFLEKIPDAEYDMLTERFDPDRDWAEKLVKCAKDAGCGYITLTARHHDGFSLYDTKGLNTYDAPHSKCGRDLVKEFTDACREQGIVPFFYHTLLDWHEKSYRGDFKKYLEYLRESVRLLCENYGKIGGIWFDGMWDRPNDDWEEDALYGMIRERQPEAMIINNTGLDARGALGHPELDSVTFERGNPKPINLENSPKYIASEMCEVMNDCWGFGADDLNYKAPARIIEEMVLCRRTRANFLLNTGPKPDGNLRTVDRGVFELIGIWMERFGEYFRYAEPAGDMRVAGGEKDFVLRCKNGKYCLFQFNLPTVADPNVSERVSKDFDVRIESELKPVKATAVDTGDELAISQEEDGFTVRGVPFAFGRNLVVRVIEIETEPAAER